MPPRCQLIKNVSNSGTTTLNTNIVYGSLTNYYVNEPGTNGGAYGFYATIGDSPQFGPPIPIDPHFDNFAIVPGVVMLESATAAAGPYVVDTGAGLEVYPKRITVPASGSTRFYRIKWLDADHIPTITGITLEGSNVVLTYN